MPKFEIRYGLSGGFGGCENKDWEVIEAKDESDAIHQAWLLTCEEYDGYAGLHGLRSLDEIMDEEGVDEDDALDIYREERENWLDYEARPV